MPAARPGCHTVIAKHTTHSKDLMLCSRLATLALAAALAACSGGSDSTLSSTAANAAAIDAVADPAITSDGHLAATIQPSGSRRTGQKSPDVGVGKVVTLCIKHSPCE
jgi:hypothetical protein